MAAIATDPGLRISVDPTSVPTATTTHGAQATHVIAGRTDSAATRVQPETTPAPSSIGESQSSLHRNRTQNASSTSSSSASSPTSPTMGTLAHTFLAAGKWRHGLNKRRSLREELSELDKNLGLHTTALAQLKDSSSDIGQVHHYP
jgi:hypothetical protein